MAEELDRQAIEAMTVAELRDTADDFGVELKQGAKKAEMIEALVTALDLDDQVPLPPEPEEEEEEEPGPIKPEYSHRWEHPSWLYDRSQEEIDKKLRSMDSEIPEEYQGEEHGDLRRAYLGLLVNNSLFDYPPRIPFKEMINES